MKVILVGGTMSVGKTTICQALKHNLDSSVFLDGDWCWDMHPFVVNDTTKEMVMNNIVYMLNNFIQSHQYEYIIFGWVMHQQDIIDEIVERLNIEDKDIYCFSLVCSKEQLSRQIQKDIDLGIRNQDVLERSLKRLDLYQSLNTIHIDTTGLSIDEVLLQLKKVFI